MTIGFFADGHPGEIFCDGAKIGSEMDLLIDDACVALSMLLQYGAEPQALAHSMGRLGDGAPASIIGALAILVAGGAGAREGGGPDCSGKLNMPRESCRPAG